MLQGPDLETRSSDVIIIHVQTSGERLNVFLEEFEVLSVTILVQITIETNRSMGMLMAYMQTIALHCMSIVIKNLSHRLLLQPPYLE